MKRLFNILSLSIFITGYCSGQETGYGPGYQMMLMNNPGFSGAEGEGMLRLSYFNFYPGNQYNLHSFYTSYDSYYPLLHGGAGFWLADDYLGGIVNDLRGGLSYAYFLHAGKELFINAGLSASLFHRGFNFDGAVLPDQIDPFGGVTFPSSEILATRGRTVFDVGAGFLFIYRNYFGGFAINHLSQPDLSHSASATDKLRRKLLINMAGNFYLNESKNLKMTPVGFLEFQGNFFSGGAGTTFETRSLSLNTIFIGDNVKNIDIQTGFSVKAGRFVLFYNYRFNVISGNNLMPFSLLHQTGLAFSLNNVEKRNNVQTISFPKL